MEYRLTIWVEELVPVLAILQEARLSVEASVEGFRHPSKVVLLVAPFLFADGLEEPVPDEPLGYLENEAP